MARKTDDERLLELEEQLEKIRVKKQQVANRIKEKERKERTRRLIQVGAIFEKYFDIVGEEEAEQVALGFKDAVHKHKSQLKNIDVDKSKKENRVIYKEGVEVDTNKDKKKLSRN